MTMTVAFEFVLSVASSININYVTQIAAPSNKCAVFVLYGFLGYGRRKQGDPLKRFFLFAVWLHCCTFEYSDF